MEQKYIRAIIIMKLQMIGITHMVFKLALIQWKNLIITHWLCIDGGQLRMETLIPDKDTINLIHIHLPII